MSGLPPVVLLCGGLGLRQREAGDDTPKPLRPLADGRPLLLHVIDYYRAFGIGEFVLCVGYGAQRIRAAVQAGFAAIAAGPRITLVDSGPAADKCERLLDARTHLGARDFLVGYADVLSDFDLGRLIDAHRASGATLSLVGTRVRSRYGEFVVGAGGQVTAFAEKPLQPALVSAGYFMCGPDLFDVLHPQSQFEADVIAGLVGAQRVHAVVHDGFWQPFDTYKDFLDAEALMGREELPWLTPA